MASVYLDSSMGELVAAVSGKIIRVRRLIITSAASGSFQLKHSVGTEAVEPIGPPFYLRLGGTSVIDLRFAADAPQTPRGANLGVWTNLYDNSYSVYVEYEVVD